MTLADFMDRHPMQAALYALLIFTILGEAFKHGAADKAASIGELVLLIASRFLLRPLSFAAGPAVLGLAIDYDRPAQRRSWWLVGLGVGLIAYWLAAAVKWWLARKAPQRKDRTP